MLRNGASSNELTRFEVQTVLRDQRQRFARKAKWEATYSNPRNRDIVAIELCARRCSVGVQMRTGIAHEKLTVDRS